MTHRVGLVVVSHSPALADAAIELAMQMAGDDPPAVAAAAGTDDGGIGTDATRVARAIEQVASPSGVLVLMDLGSAVLSAEMALELSPTFEGPVRLTSAPLVEGVLSAVVAAGLGADLDNVEREARAGLAGKQQHLDHDGTKPRAASSKPADERNPDAPPRSVDVELVNHAGLHARPAARLATAAGDASAAVTVAVLTGAGTSLRPAVDARSPTSLATLGAGRGDTIRIEATGPDADAVLDRLRRLVEGGFGEADEPVAAPSDLASEVASEAVSEEDEEVGHVNVSSGGPVGISPGRAAGPVVRLEQPSMTEPPAGPPLDDAERPTAAEQVRASADAVATSLRTRAATASSTAADVLWATATLATDPAVLDDAVAMVLEHGHNPQRAVWAAFGAVAERFREGGERLAAREVDVRSVRDQLLRWLDAEGDGDSDGVRPDLPADVVGAVLVAHELTPTDTARLDTARCAAFVTATGGPTSHVAIIARSLGIPAVAGYDDLDALVPGSTVIVDGTRGTVELDPDQPAVERLRRRGDRPASTATRFGGRGRTADDVHVPLLANIGSARDVRAALDARAEGIGLLRTELLYLDRATAPGADEQAWEYVSLLAPLGARPVVVRTLDAGSDKPLRFVTARHEANPALGVRGVRIARNQPELLEQQLAALAMADEQVTAELRVMAPMITTVEEAGWFVERCRQHGLTSAGVMIETPAAAVRSDDIAAVVDFVSIGTNDLVQYTMAADREHDELAGLHDPWHPAVLDLIATVGDAGRKHDTPVGVCGQAAGDADLAPVLIGLGVTSLSLPPSLIDAAATRLIDVTAEDCRRAANAARAATTASGARSSALDVLPNPCGKVVEDHAGRT